MLQQPYPHLLLSKPTEQRFREERILIPLLLALSLLFACFVFDSGSALAAPAYSCTSSHCYGIVDWSNNGNYTPINGAETIISVVHLYCNAPGCLTNRGGTTDFIDDEMWVRDSTHQASQCPAYGVGCWVEGGYISTPNSGSGSTQTYFWADYRPHDSHLYYHGLGVVPSGDYCCYVTVYIYRVSSTSFRVHISSVNDDFTNEYSTGNTMTPDDINIGQELQGTTGASASAADFLSNQYVSTRDNNLHFQTQNGSVSSKSPVVAYWAVTPSGSSNGGDFHTNCGC